MKGEEKLNTGISVKENGVIFVRMKTRVINIKNAEFAGKIQKIVDDKEFIFKKIKAGKFKEIKSEIKFARPL